MLVLPHPPSGCSPHLWRTAKKVQKIDKSVDHYDNDLSIHSYWICTTVRARVQARQWHYPNLVALLCIQSEWLGKSRSPLYMYKTRVRNSHPTDKECLKLTEFGCNWLWGYMIGWGATICSNRTATILANITSYWMSAKFLDILLYCPQYVTHIRTRAHYTKHSRGIVRQQLCIGYYHRALVPLCTKAGNQPDGQLCICYYI